MSHLNSSWFWNFQSPWLEDNDPSIGAVEPSEGAAYIGTPVKKHHVLIQIAILRGITPLSDI